MRLDSIGKPPILQVVPQPKEAEGQAVNSEVKRVSETPGGSLPSTGHEKLGQILDILSKAKRENSRKKSEKGKILLPELVTQEYKRVEGRYKDDSSHQGKRQRGERIDIKG